MWVEVIHYCEIIHFWYGWNIKKKNMEGKKSIQGILRSIHHLPLVNSKLWDESLMWLYLYVCVTVCRMLPWPVWNHWTRLTLWRCERCRDRRTVCAWSLRRSASWSPSSQRECPETRLVGQEPPSGISFSFSSDWQAQYVNIYFFVFFCRVCLLFTIIIARTYIKL